MKRPAFTMIELIFAIVIIAITIMSLPMMMRINSKAVENNLAQEALFASSAKMMQVLSYPWDQNSYDSNSTFSYTKVVDISGQSSQYQRALDMQGVLDSNGTFRIGHILQAGHRRFLESNSPTPFVSTLGTGSIPALSNISQIGIPFDNPGASATGYKNVYTMDVAVSYVPDTGSPYIFPSSGSTTTPTNMKLITVDIKDQNGTSITLLRSYSANIGEIDFAHRVLP